MTLWRISLVTAIVGLMSVATLIAGGLMSDSKSGLGLTWIALPFYWAAAIASVIFGVVSMTRCSSAETKEKNLRKRTMLVNFGTTLVLLLPHLVWLLL
jgi:hypothetical protein